MRYLLLSLIISACSTSPAPKSELSGVVNGTPANAANRKGTVADLYGEVSQDNDLANSSLNNNISNTSAVHPYHNIYPPGK